MMINKNIPKYGTVPELGFIVMAKGAGIHESIGCEHSSAESVLAFLSWLEEDTARLEEFMPDSDHTKVKLLYIA